MWDVALKEEKSPNFNIHFQVWEETHNKTQFQEPIKESHPDVNLDLGFITTSCF